MIYLFFEFWGLQLIYIEVQDSENLQIYYNKLFINICDKINKGEKDVIKYYYLVLFSHNVLPTNIGLGKKWGRYYVCFFQTKVSWKYFQ